VQFYVLVSKYAHCYIVQFIGRLDNNIYFHLFRYTCRSHVSEGVRGIIMSCVFPFHCNIVILTFIAFIKCSTYPVQRKTRNQKLPYFVKEDFRLDYRGRRNLEKIIEEKYVQKLKHACLMEKSYRKYA